MNCPKCQTSNPEAAKFCMNCGSSLTTVMPAPEEGIRRPQLINESLDKFIPRELMTKFEAARAQDAMVGERRVITVLFCDVKGSTATAEKVDPETWTDIINGIFELMIRPIYKEERQNFDASGHYSRPDVLQLKINRQRQSTISFGE